METSSFTFMTLFMLLGLLFYLAIFVVGVYLVVLLIKALRKYLNEGKVTPDKLLTIKSLGENIKHYRTKSKMTQEFVAESLGISRQAVSKWENGTAEPSTSNLIALSKLFNVTVESLIG